MFYKIKAEICLYLSYLYVLQKTLLWPWVTSPRQETQTIGNNKATSLINAANI